MKKTLNTTSWVMFLVLLTGNALSAYVTIGNPGFGHVDYEFDIMRYAVTNAEWSVLDPGHTSDFTGDVLPVQNISWHQAARYCNWLTSGNPLEGVYLFDREGGFIEANREQAVLKYDLCYALPTKAEWLKAAYYNAAEDRFQTYATPDDTAPDAGVDSNYSHTGPWPVNSGSEELNGTYNMMGNVREWSETFSGNYPYIFGGCYYSTTEFPLSSLSQNSIAVFNGGYSDVGFRVVRFTAIPEPTSILLLSLGALIAAGKRKNT